MLLKDSVLAVVAFISFIYLETQESMNFVGDYLSTELDYLWSTGTLLLLGLGELD